MAHFLNVMQLAGNYTCRVRQGKMLAAEQWAKSLGASEPAVPEVVGLG